MFKPLASILWKRLDVEGHDACRLDGSDDGWRLSGMAAFMQDGQPCALRYAVDCASDWTTRSATVDGWFALRDLAMTIEKTSSGWLLNGVEQASVSHCVDIDLGFTPATNLIALRRFALGVGEETQAPAAYLEFPALKLGLLEQSYRRIEQNRYAYEAARYGYFEILKVSEYGLVEDYPGLWEGKAVSLE